MKPSKALQYNIKKQSLTRTKSYLNFFKPDMAESWSFWLENLLADSLTKEQIMYSLTAQVVNYVFTVVKNSNKKVTPPSQFDARNKIVLFVEAVHHAIGFIVK